MRCKIRESVFETNSSSMHAFVVKKEGKRLTPEEYQELVAQNPTDTELALDLDEEGYLFLQEYYWGRRPFRICSSVFDKIRYCFGSFSFHDRKDYEKKLYTIDNEGRFLVDGEDVNNFIAAIQTYVPQFKGFKVATWDEETSKREYKCADWMENCVEGYDTFYTNDKTQEDFEEVLFNTKKIFVVDGDEYCDFPNLIRLGVIDKDTLETVDDKEIDKYLEEHFYEDEI